MNTLVTVDSVLEREFNVFGPGLTISTHAVERIEKKANNEPEMVRTYSKYFSQLKTLDDFILLVDSLPGLLQTFIETRRRHVDQLEEAKGLFVRWYCYGERTSHLREGILAHLVKHQKFGEEDHLSVADQRANMRPMGDYHWLPIEAMSRPLLALRDMRHVSGTFGVTYLTPSLPEPELRINPAKFLGQIRQPVDFVHYPDAKERPNLRFNPGQIAYIVDGTLKFAYDLLDYTGSAETMELSTRQFKCLRKLKERCMTKTFEAEPAMVYQQLLTMLRYANDTQEGFYSFVRGWVEAVHTSFKQL